MKSNQGKAADRSRRRDSKIGNCLISQPTPTLHRTETKKSEADQAERVEGSGTGVAVGASMVRDHARD
jgi:hypothetical protein